MSLQASSVQSVRALAACPRDLQDQLVQLLEPVAFAPGKVLHASGISSRHCYLIEAGIVALLLSDEHGDAVDVGMAGPGGFIGVPSVLNGLPSAFTSQARSAVRAWRIPAVKLRALLATTDRLAALFTAYAIAMLDRAHELVACTARHSLQQRLARWIFVASHYTEGEPLPVTHDALAKHLRVRRASITTALHCLEGEHAIHASRGLVCVRDAAALQRCSCGCHRVSKLGGGPEYADPAAWLTDPKPADPELSARSSLVARVRSNTPAGRSHTFSPKLMQPGVLHARPCGIFR